MKLMQEVELTDKVKYLTSLDKDHALAFIDCISQLVGWLA